MKRSVSVNSLLIRSTARRLCPRRELFINIDGAVAPYRVQSAYDALRLLEWVVALSKPVTASQVAAHLGEPRNRTFRLLRTLEEAGYVVQDPDTRAYQPSLKLVSLGQAVARSRTLTLVAKPVLELLREETGETVYLVARDGDEAVCLLNLESSHLVRISAQPGQRWPLGRGAAGRALLIGADADAQAEYLRRHPEIARGWERVQGRFRRDGVTFVDGRDGTISDVGVMAVAAPIPDALGRAELAVAIAWPIGRPGADYDRFRAALVDAQQALRDALGRRAGPRG